MVHVVHWHNLEYLFMEKPKNIVHATSANDVLEQQQG